MTDAPDNLADLRKDLKAALALIEERRPNYVTGREFYDGTRAEVSASKYVEKAIIKNAEAMPISLAHIPVDVIVDMIELTAVEVLDAAAATQLDKVTEANDIADESEDWLRKAAYYGDYYVIVEPGEDDVATERVVPESLRWLGSSPLTTIVIYDKADEATPLYGAKTWRDGKEWRARLLYDDCTVRLVAPKSDAPDAKSFDFDFDPGEGEEESDAYVYHEGGRMLIVHLAIEGKPYGVPLHKKAWGPQDALTKISATNLANIEAIGIPARWALLDLAAEIDDDVDSDFGTDGPDTAAADGDNMTSATRGSKVRAVPGGVTFLRGIKQVGTFESADGNIFLANQDWYVRAMAVATGIALFEFDLKGDQPSGESRRRAMSRALKKAKRVSRAAGNFLENLAETTLAVLGYSDQQATATFYPIETSTDKDGIELVGLKVKNGVPIRTALLEAGYTPELIDAWWPEDTPGVTFDILGQLGTALAQLGNAKTLGVITDEELADMLPTILTSARGEGPLVEPVEETTGDIVTNPAAIVKAKAEAWATLVDKGADPANAAVMVGLDGLELSLAVKPKPVPVA